MANYWSLEPMLLWHWAGEQFAPSRSYLSSPKLNKASDKKWHCFLLRFLCWEIKSFTHFLPALVSNLLQRRGRAGRGRKRKSKRTSWVPLVEQSICMWPEVLPQLLGSTSWFSRVWKLFKGQTLHIYFKNYFYGNMPWLPNGKAQESCPLKHRRWTHKKEITAQQRHSEATTYMNSSKQNGMVFLPTLLTMRQESTSRNNYSDCNSSTRSSPQCQHFHFLEAGPLVGDRLALHLCCDQQRT